MESSRKPKDKMKIAIIVLSVLVAISLSVTIYFAAFYATRSGLVTLNFADGLTMSLEPNNIGDFKISSTGTDATTFTFGTGAISNSNGAAFYGGIIATLNRSGWVGFKVEIYETTTGSDVAPSGAFRKNHAGFDVTFSPSGTKTDWVVGFNVSQTDFDITNNQNTFVATSKSAWSGASLTTELITNWTFKGFTNWRYIDDLAGRSFKFLMTIKASTAAAPTF